MHTFMVHTYINSWYIHTYIHGANYIHLFYTLGHSGRMLTGQKVIVWLGYPSSSDRHTRSGYPVVVYEELIVVSDVVVSPFSVNHFFPNLFYYIHRYLLLYRYQSSDGTQQHIHTLYEGCLQQMTSAMSYLADAVRSYLT